MRINPPIFPRRVDWYRQNRAFSIEKAKRELGYRPQVDIDEGLRRTARVVSGGRVSAMVTRPDGAGGPSTDTGPLDPSARGAAVKVRKVAGGGAFGVYRDVCYGPSSLAHVITAELLVLLVGWMPGALGLWLRRLLYPPLLGGCGKGVIIGRNVTFRHWKKIHLGEAVFIDDNSVVDAKGQGNAGIRFGDRVFIGRNTIVYCKGGDIRLEPEVNVSANCTVFSSNHLTIGRGTVIGAYTYLLSGGSYDPSDPAPFARQSGMNTRGRLHVGPDCWIGARVTVLDGASIGRRCVIGAGSVVTRPVPDRSLAWGPRPG